MYVNVLYKPTNITGEPHPVGIYRGFFLYMTNIDDIILLHMYIYILVGGLEDILFSIYWEESSNLTFIFLRLLKPPPISIYEYLW